ncbi:hypothetical protein ORI89_18715 [Sphingobacterium sp. UT-1RO-CII-1]|uniref:hypothetical protein n=1 Tax=Sphingobacterium sp. UT-1RO-CII-1 TaxID=2995225 RepID=UPI00227C180B|nr:hypothetical protein [Sphingobacterium sp. UT-1RO-CII-1]MCY4781690.1 hypothetical protein [Sphingobacterium sp. UT-1RO-CII-1]
MLQTRKRYPNNPYPTAKSYSVSKPANRLTNQIVDFLQLLGYQAERINTMGVMRDNRQQVTDVLGRTKMIGSTTWTRGGSTAGSADISATIEGMSVKIEVKIDTDKQSDKQKKYQQDVEAAGGVYYIARDFQSAYEWLRGFIDHVKEVRNAVRFG